MTTPFAPLPGPSGDAPRRRHLRTFAFDPMSTRLSGEFLTLSVPFELDLDAGTAKASCSQVVDYDPVRKVGMQLVDLNDTFVLAQDGLRPAEGDPRSHQQIVYAVASSVIERFERYLGRRFRWRGTRSWGWCRMPSRGATRSSTRNAEQCCSAITVPTVDPGANLPEPDDLHLPVVDIIAHEVTHGIVHRLRPHFAEATNPEVFAWHEAFADLIASIPAFRSSRSSAASR